MMSNPVLYSADLIGCEELACLAPGHLTATFVSALEHAGGTIVERVMHEFPGTGLTCVLVLRESHAVLHTWPELGTVNVDIFSCSSRLRGLDVIKDLEREFRARRVAIQQSPRAGGALPAADSRDA